MLLLEQHVYTTLRIRNNEYIYTFTVRNMYYFWRVYLVEHATCNNYWFEFRHYFRIKLGPFAEKDYTLLPLVFYIIKRPMSTRTTRCWLVIISMDNNNRYNLRGYFGKLHLLLFVNKFSPSCPEGICKSIYSLSCENITVPIFFQSRNINLSLKNNYVGFISVESLRRASVELH